MEVSVWMRLLHRAWRHNSATKLMRQLSDWIMKPAIILILSMVAFSACNHQYDSPLEGSWQLTEIYDKSTGSSSSPPKIDGHAIVLNISTSSFSGKTFNNVFTGDSYKLTGEDGITFGSLISTLVVEDSWGSPFLTVLSACMLQSQFPCEPSRYVIAGNTLIIKSPLKYDIRLRRL